MPNTDVDTPHIPPRSSTIGIDDDLSARHTGIAVGAADYKTPGRIDEEVLFVAHPTLRQGLKNVRPHDLPHLLLLDLVGMLDRDHHLGGPHRLAGDVLE